MRRSGEAYQVYIHASVAERESVKVHSRTAGEIA
jgi:hypothetical protein